MDGAPGPAKPSTATPVDHIIRFGSFEVDVRAGELRRSGIKIKLSGQPFEVLVTLLDEPGKVVTREELNEKLWSQDTFVDFEQGLNKAINKVREALGDDADNPRFIETLPRRGYRFLAPVRSDGPVDSAAQVKQSEIPSSVPMTLGRRHPFRWLAVAVAGLLAIAGIIVLSIELRQQQFPKVLHYTQLTNDGVKKSATVDSTLATDGSRVYFWEQDGQQGLIAQVSVAGGNVTTVAKVPIVRSSVLDYSPSRSELLFSPDYQSPLWAVRVPEGSARRRIGDFVVDDAAWSRDGGSIAIATLNNLMIVNADGTQPRLLVTLPGEEGIERPRWAPNGEMLRFDVSASGGQKSMWQVAQDGTRLRPVFSDWKFGNDYSGSWTPDGRYFVYNAVLPNGHASIFAIRDNTEHLDRHKAVELTPGPMSFSAPLVSPDGKRIFAIGFLDQGELVRYDRKVKKWQPYLSGISAAGIDFSRDGEWVTYVLVPEGTLWRSRVDGNERLQLTISPMRTSLPRWSPDGKQIAFSGRRPGGAWTIYLISANGGEPQQLVPEAYYYQDPTWSPDGKKVLFGGDVGDPGGIHIVDVQSRRISDVPGSKGLFSPRWSPDGRLIIANTGVSQPNPPSPQKLMIFDVAKQTWKEWSEESSSGFNYPSFSHDGKYIYFSDVEAATIYRLRMGEKKPEAFAKIDAPGGMKLTEFWYWNGLTPDDSPLFLRDSSAREIYALDVDFP